MALVYTPTDLAYLAGIIDGEGSFVAAIRTIRRGALDMQMTLKVNNTDHDLIEWLGLFGGRVHMRKKYATHCRQQWEWCIGIVELAPLLVEVTPYLRVKKRQAELLLEWWGLSRRTYRGRPADPKRIELAMEIRRLNHEGVA